METLSKLAVKSRASINQETLDFTIIRDPTLEYCFRARAINSLGVASAWSDELRIGRVVAAANKSKASGLGLQTAIVQQKAQFTIAAADKDGVRRTTGGDRFQVKICQTQPTAVDLRFELYDNENGTYSCEYTPQAAGQIEVSITIGGKPLPKSPFQIEVQPIPEPKLVSDELQNSVSKKAPTAEEAKSEGTLFKYGNDTDEVISVSSPVAGFGTTTGGAIEQGSISLKVAGMGVSFGQKMGVSFLDNEVGVDLSKTGKQSPKKGATKEEPTTPRENWFQEQTRKFGEFTRGFTRESIRPEPESPLTAPQASRAESLSPEQIKMFAEAEAEADALAMARLRADEEAKASKLAESAAKARKAMEERDASGAGPGEGRG